MNLKLWIGAVVLIVGRLACMNQQSEVIESFAPRTMADFSRDFKAVYGVERPEDLPPQDLSGVRLELSDFFYDDKKKIEDEAVTYGVVVEGDIVLRTDISYQQVMALIRTMIFPDKAPLKILLHVARTSEPTAKHACLYLGHKFLHESQKRAVAGLAYHDESMRAAVWYEYAAIKGCDVAGKILGARSDLLPLNITLPWAKQTLTDRHLFETIVGEAACHRLVLNDELKRHMQGLIVQDDVALGGISNTRISELLDSHDDDLALQLVSVVPVEHINVLSLIDIARLYFKRTDYKSATFYYLGFLQKESNELDRWRLFPRVQDDVALLQHATEVPADMRAELGQLLEGPFSTAELWRAIVAYLCEMQSQYNRIYFLGYLQKDLAGWHGFNDKPVEFEQLIAGPFSRQSMVQSLMTACLEFLRSHAHDLARMSDFERGVKCDCDILLQNVVHVSAQDYAELQALLAGPFSQEAMSRDYARDKEARRIF